MDESLEKILEPLIGLGDDDEVNGASSIPSFLWVEYLVNKFVLPYLSAERSAFRSVDIEVVRAVLNSNSPRHQDILSSELIHLDYENDATYFFEYLLFRLDKQGLRPSH